MDERRKEVCFDARPHPDLLPREKEQLSYVSGFVDECPANPGARIFKGTTNDSFSRKFDVLSAMSTGHFS
jgi:hypothetical protein